MLLRTAISMVGKNDSTCIFICVRYVLKLMLNKEQMIVTSCSDVFWGQFHINVGDDLIGDHAKKIVANNIFCFYFTQEQLLYFTYYDCSSISGNS